jgi:hypothetical protein
MKRIPAASLLLIAAVTAGAEVLTPAQALRRVAQSADAGVAAHAPALSAAPLLTVNDASAQPALYLFDNMILTAESEAEPVVGYYDEPLQGDNLPDGLQYMLDCYAEEIAALRSGSLAAPAKAYQRPQREAIAQLCSAKWGQESPYNQLCPMLNGERTVTGCVATAIAQVLYTYRYPEKCSGGTFSYTWSSGATTLSQDFDQVTFNWDKMPASVFISAAQRTAVATLMQAIGYSARMQYGTSTGNGSGCQSQYMIEGLLRNFGFAKNAILQRRAWYAYPEWEQMVYDELSRGHAVYYEGVTAANGGHAFVVDGYNTDGYFHLNWGWDGNANGYFLLSSLAPLTQGVGGSTGGYDFGQGVLIGLTPADQIEVTETPINMMCNSLSVSGKTSAKLGSTVTISGGFYNYGSEAIEQLCPGIRLINVDDTTQSVTLMSPSVASSIAIYAGFTTFSVDLPTELAAGTYRVLPVMQNPTTSTIYPARLDSSLGIFRAVVSGSTVTFRTTVPVVSFTDWQIPSAGLTAGRNFTISCTATNTNSLHYQGGIRGFLAKRKSNGDYEAVEQYTRVMLDLDADESATFTYTDAVSATVTPGTAYYFGFANDRGATVGEMQPVAVVEYQSSLQQITAAADADADAPCFDLMGRRLTSLPAGTIYIQNGKIHKK